MFLDLQIRYRSVGPIPAIPAIPGTDFVLPGSGDGLVCLGLLGFLERHSGPRHRQGPRCGNRAVGTMGPWGSWEFFWALVALKSLNFGMSLESSAKSFQFISTVQYTILFAHFAPKSFQKSYMTFSLLFLLFDTFCVSLLQAVMPFQLPGKSRNLCIVLLSCHGTSRETPWTRQQWCCALGIFGDLWGVGSVGFVGAFHNTTSAMCQLRTMSDMSGCTTRTSLSPFWSPVLLLVCLVAPWDLVEKCTTSTRLSSKRSQAGRPWCGSSKCSDCETILPAFDSRCRHWTFGRVQLGKRTFFQMLKCWIMEEMIPNVVRKWYQMNSTWIPNDTFNCTFWSSAGAWNVRQGYVWGMLGGVATWQPRLPSSWKCQSKICKAYAIVISSYISLCSDCVYIRWY